MQEQIKVLIIEDERIPATYLKTIIEEDSNFKVVDIAQSAKEALYSVKKYKPKIVFVDVMIRGSESGAEFALRLHDLYDEIIIIFLTAYSDDEMIEYATESNAFAYLLKPYRPKEIKATLLLAKARFNKSSTNVEGDKILKLKDGYSYDYSKKVLLKDEDIVPLTPKELELIDFLSANKDIVLTKEAILDYMDISDASLRSLIYRLRKQLNGNIIESSKRFGYKIALEKKGLFSEKRGRNTTT